jgi:uncharacterized protein YggL (DUF469 family)
MLDARRALRKEFQRREPAADMRSSRSGRWRGLACTSPRREVRETAREAFSAYLEKAEIIGALWSGE